MLLSHRNNFRRAVSAALGPDLSPQARWSTGTIPSLDNALTLLASRVRAECSSWDLALRDDAAALPLDNPDGHYEAALDHLARRTPTTVTGMARAFATTIVPLSTAPKTRTKAARYWRACLTWAAARDSMRNLLPMPLETLHAMLWEFTTMGASKSTLKAVLDSVIARHRSANLPSPVAGGMAYTRLVRSLGRLLGRPHAHKMAVTRDMVVDLLRYPPKNLVEFRNKLVLCTLSLGCMRPGEGALATSCNLEFDSDFRKGLLQYKDGSTLYTPFRKNDQERKGHWMRFGKSSDPDLDINFQLGLFMDLAGTRPSPACEAVRNRGKRCRFCSPLFPKLKRLPDGSWSVDNDPRPSAAAISAMVISALRLIGVDSTSYSGASCRMGGLTVATEAGVPESIMWMQSGHAQDRAARRYVRLTNPDRLYDTWRAFRL